MINNLKENQIFVFGSNLAGKHIGGAARQAKESFGALEGCSEGWVGQSYAFPTLNIDFSRRTKSELFKSRDILYKTCRSSPDKEFLLTKVGCGIAGYSEQKMKELFTDNPPDNLTLPEDWQ